METFFELATRMDVVKRAAKISLIIGTLLMLINHFDSLVSVDISLTLILKILLTYCVPYLVSTYSSVGAIQNTLPR